MIPRRIELVRAKGSRHGGGSFLVDSFNGGERERASFSHSALSSFSPVPLSTFSPSPGRVDARVYTAERWNGGKGKKKAARSQKVRGAPPLMNAATSWPPCFPSADVCTPYPAKHAPPLPLPSGPRVPARPVPIGVRADFPTPRQNRD